MLHALPRCTPLGWRPTCANGPPRFVSPRLEAVRPFASRTRPRTIPAKGFARDRPNWSRVKQIIFSTRQLLEQKKNEEAVTFFRDRLSRISSGGHTCRFGLYESGISTFLRHRRFKDAIELQDSMYKERITPSSGLRAKMFVCSSIVKAPHEQREELASLYSKLSRVLSLRSYSERSLRELLDIMKNHPLLDSHFVNRLVDDYVDSRESHPISDSDLGNDSRGLLYRLDVSTINKLILFYAQVGSIDTAASLVFSHQDSSDNPPRPANAGPYTTLLSELASSTHPLSTKRLNFLLDKMSRSQIQIDLPLLNSLVQLAVRQDKFHQAFALYNRILKDSAPHVIPDSFAFGSLFNALHAYGPPPSRRPPRARSPGRADATPTLPPDARVPHALHTNVGPAHAPRHARLDAERRAQAVHARHGLPGRARRAPDVPRARPVPRRALVPLRHHHPPRARQDGPPDRRRGAPPRQQVGHQLPRRARARRAHAPRAHHGRGHRRAAELGRRERQGQVPRPVGRGHIGPRGDAAEGGVGSRAAREAVGQGGCVDCDGGRYGEASVPAPASDEAEPGLLRDGAPGAVERKTGVETH
ncbi:hypothetical protein BC826DRAFT_982970 [Russula brevipes]|nr:hypothetical protein BC826DRAFT_982970 [Russula brevipes]